MSEQTLSHRPVDQIDQELEALKKEREESVKHEAGQALTTIKELIAKFRFTEKQVFGTTKVRAAAKVKYRDPESGKTWSGRGRKPNWLDASTPEKFAI
jgi:DNA-binding protein H-NS